VHDREKYDNSQVYFITFINVVINVIKFGLTISALLNKYSNILRLNNSSYL